MRFRAQAPKRRPILGLTGLRRTLVALGLAILVSFTLGVWCHRAGVIHGAVHELTSLRARLPILIATWFHPPDIPVLYIDMKQKNLMVLQAKRAEAMRVGLLFATGEDFVPATITLDGSRVRVNMRLKGDLTDNLLDDKWSYRVEVRGDDAIWGMRTFSLQHPRVRNWDGEWLYHEHLRREGVLALRYRFARVVFNGTDKGIYAVEEHFSKELLEAQSRREGVIVKFDETPFWRQFVALSAPQTRDLSYRAQTPAIFQGTKAAASPDMANQRDAAIQLLHSFADGKLPASRVFNVDKLARFLAVAEIWDTWHPLRWHNVRFYYDPIRARLEPIGFDANVFMEGSPSGTASGTLHALEEDWARDVLADPAVAAAYVQVLTRMVTPAYQDQLHEALWTEWNDSVINVLHVEWPDYQSSYWKQLATRQAQLARLLELEAIATARAVFPSASTATQSANREMTVRIGATGPLPVELLGFRLGQPGQDEATSDTPAPVLLPGRADGEPVRFVTSRMPQPSSFDVPVNAVCRIVGSERSHLVPVQLLQFALPTRGARPEPEPLAALLKRHPFIETTPGTTGLSVRKGEWHVPGDLVLPNGLSLTIGAGTTLRFDAGAVMLCTGALDLQGTEAAPVRLLPYKDSWAGVMVLDAPPSEWTHAEVRDTTGIIRPGWKAFSGVTVYNGTLRLADCRILGSSAEDLVNIVSGRVEFVRCEFGNCRSDAVDGDFISGTIKDCAFHDADGDALDISGSTLSVTRLTIQRIVDKAISVGERSHLSASTIQIADVGMGVASKDGSDATLDGLTIRGARVGLATYVKKPEYGSAELSVSGLTMQGVATPHLIQDGSRVVVNGKLLDTQAVDVEALYATDTASH